MAEDEEGGWISVAEPTLEHLTESQEEVVRAYAAMEDIYDLRVYRGIMTQREWTYYDVIKAYYGL